MRIKVGFDIHLGVWAPTRVIHLLRVHPSRRQDIVGEEKITVTGGLTPVQYVDSFGNLCAHVDVMEPVDAVKFTGEAIVECPDEPDPVDLGAKQHAVTDLPDEVHQFLLPSRYCDFDSELMQVAWDTFGNVPEGWERVQAISDFAHERITFDYMKARANRTALEGYREQVGVCRDFAHLFVALCRAMNIPARYVTGYLGEHGVPKSGEPMDFSAWSEVYLGGKWHTFDARHNARRMGRVVMARGRDAADVPLTMCFGPNFLKKFEVISDQVE